MEAVNQRIFDTTLDLILVVDRVGTLLRVSPSCQAILGYRPDELVGRSAADFLYAEDLESVRLEMRLGRRGRLMRSFDTRYVHKDGRVVPLAWTGVWSEPEQQHFFIGRDMTERQRIEERLRDSQRLEALGQLTGGIAHDFNNLLAIITGNLELMLEAPGDVAARREQARAAMHAAQRGAELVQGLLAFARQQSLKPRRVDVSDLVAGTIRLLGRTLGEQVEILFVGGRDLPPVFADPASLESALTNLAINARDAMPNGGRLTFETQSAFLDDEYARTNPGALPGEYVLIIVSDSGTGMTPDVLRRVFEPFFTTKPPGRGTGLGLSMVFGFVKQTGGHIKVYSEAGHGTSVRLYLPRDPSSRPPEEPARPDGEDARADQNEQILVVEDNDAIRTVVQAQLTRLGYRTLLASDAAAALEILDGGERVDLLFTDVVMPGGIHGHTLAREGRLRRPDLKVLLTSGFPGAHLAGEHDGSGRFPLLAKPYRMKEFGRKLREVLDGPQ